MADNSSFLHLSSNSSVIPLHCFMSNMSVLLITAFSVTNILLVLPLYILVLYLGCQRWRRRRPISTATTASHSDIFTYHMVAMEMITLSGCLFYCVAAYADLHEVMVYSLGIFSSTWAIKTQFLALTCVELYLAVVHPVTYLGLRTQGGIWIRNTSIVFVWLSALCVISVMLSSDTGSIVLYFCLVVFALAIVSFCCVSVLCALRRPGPGEVGEDREQVDQIKHRAFNTIVTIMGALLLGLGGMLVCEVLDLSHVLSDSDSCGVMTSSVWLTLPSSLVLPLLFLHRAGKLTGCKRTPDSG